MTELGTNGILNDMFCYKSKDFYILTLPKIASSWVNKLFIDNISLRDTSLDDNIDNNSVNINQISLNIEGISGNESYDVKEFYKDWNDLINGNEVNIDFIFLIRDPVSKFITGLMQDVILHDFKIESPHIVNILNDYPNKEELNQFMDFHQIMTEENNNDEWWHITNIKFPNFAYNVIYYVIEKILDSWLSDINNLIEYRRGHKNMNLFFCYKLLFNSKIDSSKLKIVDIDTDNIYDFITENYKVKLDKEASYKFNETADILKKIVKKVMLKYDLQLTSIISVDTLLYCDLYNHIYKTQITPDGIWYDNLLKYRYEN